MANNNVFSAGKIDKSMSSDHLYRLLVNSISDYAIFMLDEQGFVINWNTGAQALNQYTADEVVGTHFSRFYPPEAIAIKWPEHELEVARGTGRFEDEGWRLRKDGSRFWANVIVTAMRDDDGRLIGFAKITRDLSELHANQERLKRSEERFRLLVDRVRDYAIFVLDTDGNVASWNAGAQRIKGYVANDIIGQSFTRFYPEEDIEAGKPWKLLELARRRGSAHDKGWRVRKDGSRFMADVVITALHDERGALYGYAKVTRDLTQSERVEALEEEGRRINEFLAMLGHELRNPLASIRNAVGLLELDTISEQQMTWCRGVIDRQTFHLTRLVDDLLDVSRISTGKIALEREQLDLCSIVQRGVEATGQLIEAHRHKMTLNMPAGPVHLCGDPTRLVQVVSNLINNAAKYTPEGGAIDISLEGDGTDAVIRVRDNGIGIGPDLLGNVFKLFQQGDRALDRSEGGLGIGLTLVERIVALHGGTVEARSAGAGQGSEFIVRLPVTASSGRPEPKACRQPKRDEDASPRHRVLVVDDNIDAAESMAMLIQLMGNDARTVHDGSLVLATAREYHPGLVLLDIGLPGMDGYEVARQFKGSADLRHIRLAAATGYGQEDDRKRALEAGFDEFLVKPVTLEQLEALVGKLDVDEQLTQD